MEQKKKMLSLTGYINLLIAFGHLIGLLYADQIFQVAGIRKEMNKLSLIHSSVSYFFKQ
jgi:nitrate reductase gamma subunit